MGLITEKDHLSDHSMKFVGGVIENYRHPHDSSRDTSTFILPDANSMKNGYLTTVHLAKVDKGIIIPQTKTDKFNAVKNSRRYSRSI